MNERQTYRLRAPASGREAIAVVEGGRRLRRQRERRGDGARDADVAACASESALLRTPENLRLCSRCEQLIGLDVADCPYCGKRQEPLGKPA